MTRCTHENSLLAAAVLVIGAAGLVLSERHQRRHNVIATTDTHQRWLASVATQPDVLALWAPDGMEPEEYGRLTQANRPFASLFTRYRLGVLTRRTLRVQARWVMEREAGRAYWAAFGAFRESEGDDRIDRRFNTIMADEYVALMRIKFRDRHQRGVPARRAAGRPRPPAGGPPRPVVPFRYTVPRISVAMR